MGQLQEKGYEILIKDGTCRIHDPKKGLVAQVQMAANRMFPLYIQNDILPCFSAMLKDSAWLWHFCYGHLKKLMFFSLSFFWYRGERNTTLDFLIPSHEDGFMRSSSQQGHINSKIPQIINIMDLSLVQAKFITTKK